MSKKPQTKTNNDKKENLKIKSKNIQIRIERKTDITRVNSHLIEEDTELIQRSQL